MDDQEKHINENQKAAYIDWLRGEGLQPDQTVRDHVSDCDLCKQEILDLAGLLDELDKKPIEKKPSPPIFVVIRWAAALAAVMLVAMLIQFLRREPEKPVFSKQQSDTVNRMQQDSLDADSLLEGADKKDPIGLAQTDTIQFAENFVPDAGLELLVNSQFRAGNSNSSHSTDKRCKTGSVMSLDFLSEPKGDLTFTLLNNQGEELARIGSEHWQSGVPLNYDPGLYYWKVTDSEGILQVGRLKLFSHPD